MEHLPFSVSMCVYGKDNPEHFAAAVDSVLCQTCKPSEIVLVVDGPVPQALEERICSYEKEPIFNVIRLPQNVGHGEARRCGLQHCQYDYVALMDADDLNAPFRFEKQIAYFAEHRDISVVGGNITEFVDTPGNIVSRRRVPETNPRIWEYMKSRCPMNQMTVMFKKQDVEAVGGYIDWFCEEDYYLWIRLFLNGRKFYNIQEDLVNVRVGEGMYRRRGGWKYFRSEAKLQKYMRKNKIIGFPQYLVNVAKRLTVQVLIPNRLRGWVYQKFARE